MNPELSRHIWLEINPHRLIAMPVVLTLIFFMVYSMNDYNFGIPLAHTALWIFGAIGLLWGARVASDAVAEELRDKTWDTQMMSAMEPWAMTWGKLFGSTVYTWYGSVLCLLVFAFNSEFSSYGNLIESLVIALCTAIFCQAFGMLISLLALRNRVALRSSITLLAQFLGLMYLFPFLTRIFSGTGSVNWFGIDFSWIDFGLISIALAAAWAVTGVYRLMAITLQIRSTPVAWLLFAVVIGFYCIGFIFDGNEVQSQHSLFSAVVFTAYCGLSYVAAFTDRRDPIELRRLIFAVRSKNWKRALEQVPYWTASYLLALITVIYILFASSTELSTTTLQKFVLGQCIPALLLVARDIGILYYFSLAPNPKRAASAAFFYIACLYGLLPMLFAAIDLPLGRIAVLPIMADNLVGSTIIALIHAIFVFWLIIQRWRKLSSIEIT